MEAAVPADWSRRVRQTDADFQSSPGSDSAFGRDPGDVAEVPAGTCSLLLAWEVAKKDRK